MDSKSFIKKILGFSLVSWISFAVSFITVPITTRIYTPEQLGHINLFGTIANLCLFIVLLGLDQAFVRFYNEPPKGSLKDLFNNCIFIVGAAFFLFVVVTVFLKKYISLEITGSYQPIIIILLLINIFAMIILRFSAIIYRMEQKVFDYSIQALIIIFSNKLLYVISGLIQPNYMIALTLMNLSTLGIAVFYIFFQRKTYNFQRFRIDSNISKISLKYALPLIPITIVSWINYSVANLLIRHYLNFAAIGIYSSAVAIASLIGIIQSGFNIYWISYVYANYKTDNGRIQTVHRYITFILVLFGLTIILFQDIIFLLIGSKYLASKVFFSFLIISPICMTISDTTGLGIDISKKSYLHLISTSMSAVANLLCGLIFLPIIGFAGAAIASAVAGIILLIARTIIGERYYKCVDNYTSSIVAIMILIIASINSFLLNKMFFMRSIATISLLLILLLIYRKEFKRLILDAYKILIEQIKMKKTGIQNE